MNQDFNEGYMRAVNHLMAEIEVRINARKKCPCPSQSDLTTYRNLLDIYSIVAEMPNRLLKGGEHGK